MANYMNTGNVSGGNFILLDDTIREVVSREIRIQALPALVFDQFATKKEELTGNPSDTIKMIYYNRLGQGGKLTEGTPLETKAMSTYTKEIKVSEWGNAVAATELLRITSIADQIAMASRLLGDDYALVLDGAYRDELLTNAINVVFGYDVMATPRTPAANRASISSDHKMTTEVVLDAAEVLSTQNVPRFNGREYICVAHPHQLRDLREDPGWINAVNYGDPSRIYNGEVGRYESVRFIETPIMDILPGAGSGGADVYQALMFGQDSYAIAYALLPELRDDGVRDFGREHALAWYSIFGIKLLEDNRVVRIETA